MSFRKDFIWGAATASYQIEGAWNEDGRGLSVWDVYTHTPGKIFRDHNGDVACDHYHRLEEDLDMMVELGLKNYRFSVSWTRLLPDGTGAVNEKGVDFYNRLIDGLLKRGITPWMTIFHWDYPAALAARGAWENPESVRWYLDYVTLIAKRYGDRVKNFITFNEPSCFIGLGYRKAEHAPGLNVADANIVPMMHNVLLAHGQAVQILRALVPDCKVAYAPCGNPGIPATNSPEDIEAARKAYFAVPDHPMWPFCVSWWSDPAMLGVYPEDGLKRFERYLPAGWQDDLKIIHQPLDYYCQNIYQGTVYRAADNAQGFEEVIPGRGIAKTAIQWNVTPDALYWGPRFLYERYKTPFIISENGMSCHDAISLDGKVHDPNRQDYMNRYLLAYRKAAEEGVDIRGYFAWSLMDNFEWAMGYSDRFGMVFTDYENDCRRIPKDSALWYREVMKQNGENL